MDINKIINNPKLLVNNDDKKVIMQLVSKKGTMLQYASNKLKDDEEIVKTAINNDYIALKYASDNLKNNKELILFAINKNGLALEFVSEELKQNYEILLYAVCKNGLALKFISEEYRSDELIFLAVLQNNNAINYIDEISDKYLALSLGMITQNVINHLSYELLFDKEFMLELVESNPTYLKRIKNKDIALYILSKHNEYIKYMPERFMQSDTVYEVIQILNKDLIRENNELKSQNDNLISENIRLRNMLEQQKIRTKKF